MKKQILFVMAFYCLYGTQAQPVLTKAEGFKPGIKITTYNVQAPSITTGGAGAGATWNFSFLPLSNDTMVMEILTTVSTTYGSSFPTANYAEKHGNGSLAYIHKAGNTLELLGFVPPASSVMWYHNPYTFFKIPFAYQDIVNDTARRGYKLLGDSLTGTGMTRTIADAWGTLILPNATYNNVLRIKFEQDFYDTAQISNVITHTRTASYAWFDTGHYSSLLKIDSTIIQSPVYQDTIVSIQILKQEVTTGIITPMPKQNFRGFYNNDQIVINGELQTGDRITVSICDAAGRQVDKLSLRQEEAAHRRTINVGHLPMGLMYLARVGILRNGNTWSTSVKFLR